MCRETRPGLYLACSCAVPEALRSSARMSASTHSTCAGPQPRPCWLRCLQPEIITAQNVVIAANYTCSCACKTVRYLGSHSGLVSRSAALTGMLLVKLSESPHLGFQRGYQARRIGGRPLHVRDGSPGPQGVWADTRGAQAGYRRRPAVLPGQALQGCQVCPAVLPSAQGSAGHRGRARQVRAGLLGRGRFGRLCAPHGAALRRPQCRRASPCSHGAGWRLLRAARGLRPCAGHGCDSFDGSAWRRRAALWCRASLQRPEALQRSSLRGGLLRTRRATYHRRTDSV